jgi:hypothetical protein
MTPKAQRIAIAEACGWKETEAWLDGRRCFERADINAGWDFDSLPDYLNDLNAMHEAEKVLTTAQTTTMSQYLHRRLGMLWGFATASQRAEAFLRTIGKWKECK